MALISCHAEAGGANGKYIIFLNAEKIIFHVTRTNVPSFLSEIRDTEYKLSRKFTLVET